MIDNLIEFLEVLGKFIYSWPTLCQDEKILILIHHWLDALGCWSFEDFYLSATTLLQIIAAAEQHIAGTRMYYLQAIQSASVRANISALSSEFKDMRNNLIHEGKLLGGRFTGRDILSCSAVAADLMNWFDEYVHSVLNLGTVRRRRYLRGDFVSLNSFSIN